MWVVLVIQGKNETSGQTCGSFLLGTNMMQNKEKNESPEETRLGESLLGFSLGYIILEKKGIGTREWGKLSGIVFQ